jgi:hypothetical protein
VPFVHLDLRAAGKHDRTFGVADINIQNYLGGMNKRHTFFYYFGLDTFIPVGNFDAKNLANPADHYFTFAPNANFTWIPDKRWEITGTLFSQFNLRNKATDYHSGSDIDFDYGVTYRPLSHDPNFGLGLNGYFYKQLGRDTLDGATVAPDGNKGREFGIGPQLRYDVPFGGFALKLQRTFAVRNRPSGTRIWFQFAVPLSGMPKHE